MNDRKVNQYNQQEKKKRRTGKQSKKSKEERKKKFRWLCRNPLSVFFSLFLSDSVTLSLSLTHSLSHFVSFFSAVSPHNLKLTGGREGQKKKFVTWWKAKKAKKNNFFVLKWLKKLVFHLLCTPPSFTHSPTLTLSFFLSPLFDFNFSFCCKHLLSQVN